MNQLTFARKCSDPEQRILLFTDLHFPAHSEQAVEELGILIEEFKPTKIVNLGDAFDNKEAGRWVKDTLHIVTMETGKPLPETYKEGIELLDTLIDKAQKGCDVLTLWGNHDDWTRQNLEKMKHITGDFNPLIAAWQQSRHAQKYAKNWPNNDQPLLPSLNLLVSHQGAGTSGNHAKGTWSKDYQLNVSRIYGHAHDPQHWFGSSSINPMARDDRFSIALGAMCDRNHAYFSGYSERRPRHQWRPTVLLIDVSNNFAHFEQVDLTPEPMPYDMPQLIGQGLHV